MSREHRKNLKRGLRAALVNRTQRHREGRHGKPHVMRKRSVKQNADGKVVVNYEWFPVPDDGYDRKVAAGPTAQYGQKNTGGTSAGKKSARPKEAK